MATVTGLHSDRVRRARELLAGKGRREQGRFAFEGPTLLEEAMRSGAQILEIYVTSAVYERESAVREAEASGSEVFLIDDRAVARLSDVETATGLIAIAPTRYTPLENIVRSKRSLVLAGVSDPGNAGTLMRSAEAFHAQGVLFSPDGVDPYHPKVVRAAMGSLFRLAVAVASPDAFAEAASAAATDVLGLDMAGTDIRTVVPGERTAIVVGHERRGLGPWRNACTQTVAIPMDRTTESLNAAVAGSIALFSLCSPS